MFGLSKNNIPQRPVLTEDYWYDAALEKPEHDECVWVIMVLVDGTAMYSFSKYREVPGTSGEWITSAQVAGIIAYWCRIPPMPRILQLPEGRA